MYIEFMETLKELLFSDARLREPIVKPAFDALRWLGSMINTNEPHKFLLFRKPIQELPVEHELSLRGKPGMLDADFHLPQEATIIEDPVSTVVLCDLVAQQQGVNHPRFFAILEGDKTAGSKGAIDSDPFLSRLVWRASFPPGTYAAFFWRASFPPGTYAAFWGMVLSVDNLTPTNVPPAAMGVRPFGAAVFDKEKLYQHTLSTEIPYLVDKSTLRPEDLVENPELLEMTGRIGTHIVQNLTMAFLQVAYHNLLVEDDSTGDSA